MVERQSQEKNTDQAFAAVKHTDQSKQQQIKCFER